jgi:AraC-like DNA-binding protein
MLTQLAVPRRWSSESQPPLRPIHPVVVLRPPYDHRDLRPALAGTGRDDVTPGTIVGVHVSHPRIDAVAVGEIVRDLTRRWQSCPVVVFLEMSAEEAILVSARLSAARPRAVVGIGPEMPTVLRDVLTDPNRLGSEVVDWLHLRQIRLNPNQADLLEKIFASAAEHGELTSLLELYRIPQSSARFRLRKRGLPSPNRWFQVARAVHAALRLQARPEASVAAVAHQLGFVDHSALAHLLRRSLNLTANQIRGTLGWEWLLDRWLRSNGVLAR